MSSCVICESPITPFISFGKQPISSCFANEFEDETFFELSVACCDKCKMVQLLNQPEAEKMFNENYTFFTGTSKRMSEHFAKLALDVYSTYLSNIEPFVIEIGSNDGTLLKTLAAKGIRHLGIDPSKNVCEAAKNYGISTLCAFFNANSAQEILQTKGMVDAILATNVICHIPYLRSVIEGMKKLLKPKGVIVFEEPYFGDVIEKTSFDQIYDEHMFLFTLTSIKDLFQQYDLELIDAQHQDVHGGSMRYTLAHKGAYPVKTSVDEGLSKERSGALFDRTTLDDFRKRCETTKDELTRLLTRLKSEGKWVIGYAATAKSSTLLNYCQIGPDLIEYICDSTPLKQGRCTPGMHIPVKSPVYFQKHPPDYAVLFAWNHQEEILAKEKNYTNNGGKWILFVPKVEIL